MTELGKLVHAVVPFVVDRAVRAGAPDADSDASSVLGQLVGWMAQQPFAGGARLAAALTRVDAATAPESPVVRRAALLQHLVRIVGCGGAAAGAVAAPGKAAAGKAAASKAMADPREVPLEVVARFACALHGRSERWAAATALATAEVTHASLRRRVDGATTEAARAAARQSVALFEKLIGSRRGAGDAPPLLAALRPRLPPAAATPSKEKPPLEAEAEAQRAAALRAKLDEAKREEAELQAELIQRRAAHQRSEARGGVGFGAPDSALVAELKAELARLIAARGAAEGRLADLKQKRTRVRPKDLETLERAAELERKAFLTSPAFNDLVAQKRAGRAAAAELRTARARIKSLAAEKAALHKQSAAKRGALARRSAENAVLRAEIARAEISV